MIGFLRDKSGSKGKLRLALLIDAPLREWLFPESVVSRLSKAAEIYLPDSESSPTAIGQVDILVTSWGSSEVDDRLLDRFSAVKLVAHCAGSVRGAVARSTWDRGIRVVTASAAIATSVAEYAVAMIVLSLKDSFGLEQKYRDRDRAVDWRRPPPGGFGVFGATVGLVGASTIGRAVADRLRAHDVRVLIFDPLVDAKTIRQLGATPVAFDKLLDESEIVSLHAPLLQSTRTMIGRRELRRMRDGAVLINTARGGLVDHAALLEELKACRLHAVLDVTEPEPLDAGSEFWSAPNLVLTPHIAGARGRELARLGHAITDDILAFQAGRPMIGEVLKRDLDARA